MLNVFGIFRVTISNYFDRSTEGSLIVTMTFYTYNYLHATQHTWQYARVIVISILVVVFILFMLHYLRNKMDIKYKDLSVIIATLLLLILGMQYDDYSNIKSSSQQTGQMTTLVKEVAKRLEVQTDEVSVNATSQNQNLLVKTPKGYYRVDFNTDGSQFVLEKVDLHQANNIQVEDK